MPPPFHRTVAETFVYIEHFFQHAGTALRALLEQHRIWSGQIHPEVDVHLRRSVTRKEKTSLTERRVAEKSYHTAARTGRSPIKAWSRLRARNFGCHRWREGVLGIRETSL